MKEGKKPLTDDEMKAKLQLRRNREQEEARQKLHEAQKKKDESVRSLVENALQTTERSHNLIGQDEKKLKTE